MKFCTKIKKLIIKLLTKIKCKSSCFNTTNVDDHSVTIETMDTIETLENSPLFQEYVRSIIKIGLSQQTSPRSCQKQQSL